MNRARKILELDKVLTILSKYAITEDGKIKCTNLNEETILKRINYNLELTNLAQKMIISDTTAKIFVFKNMKEIIKRVELNAILSLFEIYQIKRMFENVRILKSYIDEEDENLLKKIFDDLIYIPKLVSMLKFVHEESIDDEASEELLNVRRNINKKNDSLRAVLNELLVKYSNYLQDNIITIRNGRYCIPIKSEYKSNVKGIVHDSSASGSTFFIEPISIIDINNEIESLKIREKNEINRILEELSNNIYENFDVIRNNYNTIVNIDFIFAKANMSIDMNATRPIICTDSKIDLKDARHPLIDKKRVVPINIKLDNDINQMIITGPNTGGKTVTLKTVGLLTLMAQCGLNIPAKEGSEIVIYDSIFADIGDEQSIEQNLSTFSSHMTNIIYILNHVDKNSLVLMDELGAGTDPVEGAALALSILNHLNDKAIMTFATTHYSEIKYYASTTRGVINASCEFDVKTLMPTYKLIVGIAGKSNAFEISKKLGLNSSIIEQAKKNIEDKTASIEDVLLDLDDKKRHINDMYEDANKKYEDAQKLLESASKKRDEIDDKKDDILEKARIEASKILESAKKIADETIITFQKKSNNLSINKLEEKRSKLQKKIKENQVTRNIIIKKADKSLNVNDIKIGDKVFVTSYNSDATVETLPDNKGMLFVSFGAIKVKVKTTEITNSKNTPEQKQEVPIKTSFRSMKSMNVSPEIKLLGYYSDEAVSILDKYIDDAVISGLASVRIVHGKGSGQLRKAIHNYLRKNPSVKSFDLAEYGQGDAGVTIAVLK